MPQDVLLKVTTYFWLNLAGVKMNSEPLCK